MTSIGTLGARWVVMLAALIAWRGIAAAQVRTLTVSPSVRLVPTGGTASVDLVVDDATDLLAADIGIVYDGSVLSVQPAGATTATGCFLTANMAPDGNICLGLACTNPLMGTNVTLASIQFSNITAMMPPGPDAPTGISAVTISSAGCHGSTPPAGGCLLNDNSPDDDSCLVSNGLINVGAPPTATPTTVSATPTSVPTVTATATPEDGGFAPPDANTAKCEKLFAKQRKKLSLCSTKCQLKQADAALKGQAFDDDACEEGIGKPVSCRASYDAAVSKLLGRVPPICPPCINPTTQTTVADGVLHFADDNNGLIYCAGTTPLGGDDTGFVPPDANAAGCEKLVAKNVKKLFVCMTKCQIKQAGAALKGVPFDEEACEEGSGKPISCRASYDKTTTKLLGRMPAICPACLDATAQSHLADLVINFVDNSNGSIYCAGSTPLP